jgi:hypothetical protein
MSLVGSLDDLGLGDILQIISLSRKSGVLMLRSDHGEGQILFRDGRVTGAWCKGGPTDLRSLLVAAGDISEQDFAAAARTARVGGTDLETALYALPALSHERIDEIRERNLERAAFAMFAWPTGEFSFDVREDLDTLDPALCVPGGIDAQYLAMEGARLRDEEERDEPLPEDASDPASFADLGAELREEAPQPPAVTAEEIFARAEELPAAEVEAEAIAEVLSVEEAGVAAPIAASGEDTDVHLEPMAEVVTEAEDGASAEAVDHAPADAAEVIALSTAEHVGGEPFAEIEPAPALAPAADAAEPSPVHEPRSTTPVVVVDTDLAMLEWAKRALGDHHERIHIFQKTELAIARIRQYLVRRETPVVVLSDGAPPDPNSGARTPSEIIRRLKLQAPRMSILLLVDRPGPSDLAGADGAVARPSQSDLYNPRRSDAVEELSEALRRAVSAHGGGPGRPAEFARVEPRALRRLREVSAQLREAAVRGEIIPMVMSFAAEHFSRVAMFLVRDDLAVGMAQLGLDRGGGPDDAELREMALPADEPAWFRAVCAKRAAVRGPPSDDGDRRLLRMLGGRDPAEAYVAPLESGDRVVALLYADNLPDGPPLGDTHALEIVLHEAGLALDRAALERQLAEVEAGDR